MTQTEEPHRLTTRIVPAWILGTGLVASVFAVVYHPPVSIVFGCSLLFFYAVVISSGIAIALKSYAEPRLTNSTHPLFARIFFYTSTILPIFACLVFSNAHLDSSQPTDYEASAEFKFSRSTKQGMRYSVDVPAPADLGGPLGEAISLPVDREVYERTVLGHTKVKFRVRNGWLKVPWRDGYEIVAETLVPPGPRQSN